MLNVPVLLWKEEGRPALAIFATTLPRSFPPQLQSITNPLPPFLKAAGLQTVKVQSDSDCSPVHGALCLDYTKLRPHKISRCVAASFRHVVLA